jgi:hypothetical protein
VLCRIPVYFTRPLLFFAAQLKQQPTFPAFRIRSLYVRSSANLPGNSFAFRGARYNRLMQFYDANHHYYQFCNCPLLVVLYITSTMVCTHSLYAFTTVSVYEEMIQFASGVWEYHIFAFEFATPREVRNICWILLNKVYSHFSLTNNGHLLPFITFHFFPVCSAYESAQFFCALKSSSGEKLGKG